MSWKSLMASEAEGAVGKTVEAIVLMRLETSMLEVFAERMGIRGE